METQADHIPIKSQTRTIQECFRQCLYEVPMFQRPYSWESDQLEDYWNDVILAKGDFFFGSTVTWVSEKRELFNDTYSIIDGQQRLTTSTIALSVVRDAFTRIAAKFPAESEEYRLSMNQSRATEKYLIATDDDGNEYPVLKRSEPMFYTSIQKPNAIPSTQSWNGSALRIGEARKFFERKILVTLSSAQEDDQMEILKRIRDNMLKARIIQVELSSEEDGFLIFETLNTRGADLRLSDLVKNLLVRDGSAESADRETIADRWDTVAEKVQKDAVDRGIFDRFIWQSWNSRRTAVTEPELFKEISALVKESDQGHLSYLKELESDAETYQWLGSESVIVEDPVQGVRNPFAIPQFVDSVRALSIFNVSVANSTILAVSRKYRETKLISDSQLIDVMRSVENFHFQFNALTSSGSTGGTRGRYNRFAERLESARSRDVIANEIAGLKSKLQTSLPTSEKVEAAFMKLFYAPKISLNQSQRPRARKVFIAYVLMAFAKHNKVITPGQNLITWSIEHIKPQCLAGDSYLESIYSIGNLTLISKELNSDIGNGNFAAKKEALKAGSAYVDPVLHEWWNTVVEHPSDLEIKERAAQLANIAVREVWAI